MDEINQDTWILIFRILLAGGLGAALGLERDIHGRAAGLRTHILVSMGAAVFTVLSTHLVIFAPAMIQGFSKVNDPARIAAQVVTGIGFLGAGAIIKDGITVRGLTTAASLWVTAAIGMASGGGFLLIATTTTFFTLFSLLVLSWFEKSFHRVNYRDLILTVPADTDVESITKLLEIKELKILTINLTYDYEKDVAMVTLFLRLSSQADPKKLMQNVFLNIKQSEIPIKKAEWQNR